MFGDITLTPNGEIRKINLIEWYRHNVSVFGITIKDGEAVLTSLEKNGRSGFNT